MIPRAKYDQLKHAEAEFYQSNTISLYKIKNTIHGANMYLYKRIEISREFQDQI